MERLKVSKRASLLFSCSFLTPHKSLCRNCYSTISNKSLWIWGTAPKTGWSKQPSDIQQTPHRISLFESRRIELLAVGYDHVVFTSDDKLYSFGNNDYGQLGRPTTPGNLKPDAVALPCNGRVVSAAVGHWHTAVVTDDGLLYTWG